MPHTQPSTSGRHGGAGSTARGKESPSPKRAPAARGAPAESAAAESAATQMEMVESDETYGVISVLYHALQGAETLGQYIDDAKAAQNEQLVAFFEDCRAKQNEMALEGKRLLAEQLIDLAEDAEEAADEDNDDE